MSSLAPRIFARFIIVFFILFTSYQGYIDASEDGFDATVSLGNQMIQEEFEAKAEIGDNIQNLNAKRDEMLAVWEQKKLEYDERSELQSFKRDIEQMEVIMVKQEVILNFSLFSQF